MTGGTIRLDNILETISNNLAVLYKWKNPPAALRDVMSKIQNEFEG